MFANISVNNTFFLPIIAPFSSRSQKSSPQCLFFPEDSKKKNLNTSTIMFFTKHHELFILWEEEWQKQALTAFLQTVIQTPHSFLHCISDIRFTGTLQIQNQNNAGWNVTLAITICEQLPTR